MENPHIAGNIVKQHDLKEYPHALYFEGMVERVADETDRELIYSFFKKCLGSSEAILEEARHDDGHQFYKIRVETWYAFGKFGGDNGQKYELKWNGGSR